jgi:uncharacterized protein DUF5661
MTFRSRFTLDEARAAGERIGVDWGSAPFDLEQFRMGMNVELEHGTRDPETNVTDDDLIMTAKIEGPPQRVPGLLHPPRQDEDRGEGGGERDRPGRVSADIARR